MTMLPSLKEVVRREGLSARKALGQHFLLDGDVPRQAVALSGPLHGVHVVEIGPGPGGLTRAILASDVASVLAFEKDTRFRPALSQLEASDSRLTTCYQDALTLDLPSLVPAPRAVIANLPYNIGTVLLVRWLHDIARLGPGAYRCLTLMFQKEVAGRLLAPPGCKAYGRLSVLAQYLCRIEHGFDVPPHAFTPPPAVWSSVIRVTPHPTLPFQAPLEALEKTLAAAFGQRRKMLRGALKPLTPTPDLWLARAEIDPTRRAETLSVEEFCRLATALPTQETA